MSGAFTRGSIRIDSNAAEISSMLRGQPYRRAENALRASMRAAAKVVQIEARALVAVDTGALKKSIAVKVSAVKGGAFARVGVIDRREYIVVKKATKTGVTARAGRRVKSGESVKRSQKKVPIMYAPKIETKQPFLKPALERKSAAVARVIADRLKLELAKPWPKGKSKTARVWA